MALQLDTVNHACEQVTRQVRDHYRNLTVMFVPHHDGQLTEALGLAAQYMLTHPASETALNLMRKRRTTEESVLMGTAVAREQILFGLASRDSALALCTLNLDTFDTLKDARRMAYHLAWHAMDAFAYHNDPATHDADASRIAVRRRNALDIAGANLRADAFSGILCSLQDDYEAVRKIAAMRGLNALQRRSGHAPEYYPFAIAMEATEFAAQMLRKRNLPRKKLLPAALQAAHEIGLTFDHVLLRQWLGFSQPAQDMAWRGFEKDEILSAAINTSQNTYVRAAGYMISEITNIPPASIFDINESYSPFADDKFNEKLHQKLVNQIFEDVIAEGLKRNSSEPFFETAERQNQQMTEGMVVGWCASALQAAARGFDNALASGTQPAAAARREFDNEKDRTAWDTLRDLGKKIIRQTRIGTPVTMSTLAGMADENPAHAAIRRSVQATIKTPAYQQRLDAASELHARPNVPRGPAPRAAQKLQAAPAVNAPAMAAPGMGMGGGGMGGGIRRTTVPAQQTRTARTTSSTGDDKAGTK
jgi:hypothetical protein